MISPSLLKESCATDGDPTLAKLLDLFVGTETSSHRQFMEFAKLKMTEQIEAERQKYLENPEAVQKRFPRLPVTDRSKMLYVISEVYRRVVEAAKGPRHFQWQPNDALDMGHAMVGLRCADAMVLDGKWKSVVSGITPIQVFSCGEFDDFLAWFEAYPARVAPS